MKMIQNNCQKQILKLCEQLALEQKRQEEDEKLWEVLTSKELYELTKKNILEEKKRMKIKTTEKFVMD